MHDEETNSLSSGDRQGDTAFIRSTKCTDKETGDTAAAAAAAVAHFSQGREHPQYARLHRQTGERLLRLLELLQT